MKKRKSKSRHGPHLKPSPAQLRRLKELARTDTLKFYKAMCAAMVRRAGGRTIIEKEEFEHMQGLLQWRRTDQGGIEFLFVGGSQEKEEAP